MCCLLLGYVVIINIFVLPVIQALLGSTGATLLAPTRLTFLLAGKGGLLIPLLAIVILLVGQLRGRAAERADSPMTALHAANLLLVVYVAFQCSVWIDTAIAIPKMADSWPRAHSAATLRIPLMGNTRIGDREHVGLGCGA